ncbi:uncharacterized protein DNG_04118 [Cephalotrichum gorgonifer]|uniref:Protein HRI1 n=1 Tax=Cephalotrichum gorgonifer TaxID=2041049 RepID=A0AAE8MVG5_9PEZI|nr:uncharacterized protein DNG_04118 [Cephalotrichum gorgonifer]
MAHISIRKHICWLPAPASEPTSTLVLTSPGKRFVDVRILLPQGAAAEEEERLDWAFAGTSSSRPVENSGNRYAVWKHWVDSLTIEAETVRDEAEVRDAGEVELEAGRMVNPATGIEADYEEAWGSVEPIATESSGDRPVCVVLQTVDDGVGVRGMVVRVGQFCQGILRAGGDVTVERWEWREGEWTLSARFGEGRLPVHALAGDVANLVVDEVVQDGERAWRIVEVVGSGR